MSDYILLKWNSFVNLFIFFVLGLLFLIFPEESLSIGGYLIASVLLLLAMGRIIKIIKNKGIETNSDILFILLSIAFIVLSIYIFLNPEWIIKVITTFVGIIIVVISIMNMISLLKLKKNRNKLYWIYFSFIILIFLAGLLAIMDPPFIAKIVVQIEGATMIINSIITFLIARRVQKALDSVNKIVENSLDITTQSEN